VNVASTIAPGRDFLFANLHGRWSGALRGDELRRIVQSGSSDLLLRALAGRGLRVESLADARRLLVVGLADELAKLMALADPATARFYQAFLFRFWYEDLKTVLHVRALGVRDVPPEDLLLDLEALPKLPYTQLLEARNGAAFAAALPKPHRRSDAIAAIVDELATTGNIPVADAAFDRLFFAEFMVAAERCPRSARPLAVALVGLEIDTANVITILRNRRTYQLPVEEVRALCIPGGPGTDGRKLEPLLDARSPAEAAVKLPRPLSSCLRDRQLDELANVEDSLRRALFQLARRGFHDFERPARTSIAYPYLRWWEDLDIGRVCEGIRFGMVPAELSRILIGEGAYV
jgi:vacuolar-type H+-ATPase subunit C/Vma6